MSQESQIKQPDGEKPPEAALSDIQDNETTKNPQDLSKTHSSANPDFSNQPTATPPPTEKPQPNNTTVQKPKSRLDKFRERLNKL